MFHEEYNIYKNKYKDYMTFELPPNQKACEYVFLKRYLASPTTELHRHIYFQINYISQGDGKHVLVDHAFDIKKGDIFIVPPYIPHKIISVENNPCEVVEFEFMPEFINQNFSDFEDITSFIDFAYVEPFLVSEKKLKPRLALSGKTQYEVETLLKEAEEEFGRKQPGYILLIRAILLKLLIVLGRKYNEIEPKQGILDLHSEAIWQAVEYIKEHYSEKLTLNAIAKKFNFSPSYFSYLFANVTSKTFSEYLTAVRINMAIQLLSETDMPISAVSEMVGFSDLSNFYRTFRQQTGQTPKSFRKQ